MQRTYSHRSLEDLLALREDLSKLKKLNDMRRAAIVGYTMISGIIKPPLLARISLGLLRKRFGDIEGTQRFVKILASKPTQLNALWEGTMNWMTEGKDTFDRLSAGGWNKAQLDGLLEFAGKLGFNVELDSIQETDLVQETGNAHSL